MVCISLVEGRGLRGRCQACSEGSVRCCILDFSQETKKWWCSMRPFPDVDKAPILMFSSSCFSEISILWMSKMWRRITSWPLMLLRRNWAFLPSWQAKKWPQSGSLTSCPWWCTWPSSTRCSGTLCPLVVRAAALAQKASCPLLLPGLPSLLCFWPSPSWGPPEAGLHSLCVPCLAVGGSPWNCAPLFSPPLLVCSPLHILPLLFLTKSTNGQKSFLSEMSP